MFKIIKYTCRWSYSYKKKFNKTELTRYIVKVQITIPNLSFKIFVLKCITILYKVYKVTLTQLN